MNTDAELEAWRADWQAGGDAPPPPPMTKTGFADEDFAIDTARFVERCVRRRRARLLATGLAAAASAVLAAFWWPTALLAPALLWHAWKTRNELAWLKELRSVGCCPWPGDSSRRRASFRAGKRRHLKGG